MPLQLPQFSFAIECDETELETFDVKQEDPSDPSLIAAFVASQAGKQFSITYRNELLDIGLAIYLRIDGEVVHKSYVPARQDSRIIGIEKNSTSILPFKFQELELVDPDVEDAPVVPEMGTIEVQAFRVRYLRTVQSRPQANHRLHGGRVSERSKKAGWHHVSTADEVHFDDRQAPVVEVEWVDPESAPCATFKVFYRPRELLVAQGVIPGHDLAAGSGRSRINDRKRTRENEPPGPSKRRPAPTIKKEEMSVDARAQRIQDLQAELNSLMAEHSTSSVKRELRSPSPIVVGKAANEVVDLTLEE